MSRGFFLTFEGTEGSGKSTQLRLLADRLRADGYVVTVNQEPGGTAIGKQVRRILLDPSHLEMDAETELLLMFASRAQAAHETIRPALGRGEIVVSDRFTDSSMAYQGAARALGFAHVAALHDLVLGSLKPDLTICVDVDLETGLARANRRNEAGDGASEARIDVQSLEFHRRVQEAYDEIARAEPHRFHIIDGRGSPEEVAGRIWTVVHEKLQAASELKGRA